MRITGNNSMTNSTANAAAVTQGAKGGAAAGAASGAAAGAATGQNSGTNKPVAGAPVDKVNISPVVKALMDIAELARGSVDFREEAEEFIVEGVEEGSISQSDAKLAMDIYERKGGFMKAAGNNSTGQTSSAAGTAAGTPTGTTTGSATGTATGSAAAGAATGTTTGSATGTTTGSAAAGTPTGTTTGSATGTATGAATSTATGAALGALTGQSGANKTVAGGPAGTGQFSPVVKKLIEIAELARVSVDFRKEAEDFIMDGVKEGSISRSDAMFAMDIYSKVVDFYNKHPHTL